MAIIVHSPHDGQPVKVRDQDLQRAIRDGEGRIFYAVKRTDGQGYYGALTRKGSDKDEQRYIDMITKMETAREVGKVRSDAQIHDATGKAQGPGMLRWVLLLIVAGAIALVTWYLVKPDNAGPAPLPTPQQPEAAPDAAEQVRAGSTLPRSHGGSVKFVHQHNGVFDGQGYINTATGLRYKIMEPGTGDTAASGSFVLLAYCGMRMNGEVFDQSPPDRPVGFILWAGDVPRGWDEGVVGMRVGERRRLILNPDLVCGPYPGDVVVPDGTLCFDVELVGILPGVRLTVEEPGDGVIARPGDTVKVHYTAYVGRDARPYHSTYDGEEPDEMRVGTGEVIPGWEVGVVGMAEGETRLIEIPPYLAYGQRGAAGIIPPGASLRYRVELVQVKSSSARHAAVVRQRGG